VLCHENETTTRVDYVNSYSSTLQTTPYHIMESKTTPQACEGVVKAAGTKRKPENANQKMQTEKTQTRKCRTRKCRPTIKSNN
jgi:hypothetical protein